MCTVTLLPLSKQNFILTSNRDEDIHRKTIFPKIYQEENTHLLYPKDQQGGGTWIGISSQHRMICLLNGGFENHVRKLPYRKSRGTIVTDLLKTDSLEKSLKGYNFMNIEPFTLVVADWEKDLIFREIVWDGKKLHNNTLRNCLHLWSSSTLYTPEMKSKRKEWLDEFQNNNPLNNKSLLDFHKNGGQGHPDCGLQIDRGTLKTRSITQIIKTTDDLLMRYENLQEKRVITVGFEHMVVH